MTQETSNLNFVLPRKLLEDFRQTAEERAINGSEFIRRFIEKFNSDPVRWINLVLIPETVGDKESTKAPNDSPASH